MRREKILKICLNHRLTPDIEYLPKDEKTWLFHAADFSEGEIQRDQFCLRFKTPELAEEFKHAVGDALSGKLATICKSDVFVYGSGFLIGSLFLYMLYRKYR